MVALQEISPLVFGAGALVPESGDIPGLLEYALDNGFNAFDTAACYGPSESLLGEGLEKIGSDPQYSREKYFLISKAGRWEDDTVDYTDVSIRHSVSRSLERLRTSYLDLLIINDVEFGAVDEILRALSTAFALKKEGKVRNVGISGYPLSVILLIIETSRTKLQAAPDAVLSYSNMTLQNCLLLRYAVQFKKHGVRAVFNAAPLSMSLLRSRPPHNHHPARPGLRRTTASIAQKLQDRGIEMGDVALQYSLATWTANGPTIVRIKDKKQIDSILANRESALEHPQPELWKNIIDDFGEYYNYTWPSP